MSRTRTIRQWCGHGTRPSYHQLVWAFHEFTRVPLVLNTSFNDAGEPIVEPRAATLLTNTFELAPYSLPSWGVGANECWEYGDDVIAVQYGQPPDPAWTWPDANGRPQGHRVPRSHRDVDWDEAKVFRGRRQAAGSAKRIPSPHTRNRYTPAKAGHPNGSPAAYAIGCVLLVPQPRRTSDHPLLPPAASGVDQQSRSCAPLLETSEGCIPAQNDQHQVALQRRQGERVTAM